MAVNLLVLSGTAASIGLLHTLLGPDHYLPFVAMARAGRWSLTKTALVTMLCGLGHVLGSVALGLAGIGLGIGVLKLESVESLRGDIAGWLVLTFGLVYLAWGLRRAFRAKPHAHWHGHADGTVHVHEHVHEAEHVHVHAHPSVVRNDGRTDAGSLTPWVLFTIFILGPCEPLIPLLMYPAAEASLAGVVLVAAIFGLTTIVTMTTIVLLASAGMRSVRFTGMERFSHAAAGLVIALCGAAIQIGL